MYRIPYLQAVEYEHLPAVAGIRVDVLGERDDMGFARVDVYGPTPEAVIAYVREHWGDEDPQWFLEYVVNRVEHVAP